MHSQTGAPDFPEVLQAWAAVHCAHLGAASPEQVHNSRLQFCCVAVLLCRLGDSQQKQQGGSPPEVEMVVLRFSLELRSPGCMHFVLESVSPKPPYLIENRTAHPFRYRQSLRQGGGLDTVFLNLLAFHSDGRFSVHHAGHHCDKPARIVVEVAWMHLVEPLVEPSAMCRQMSLMHRTELADRAADNPQGWLQHACGSAIPKQFLMSQHSQARTCRPFPSLVRLQSACQA